MMELIIQLKSKGTENWRTVYQLPEDNNLDASELLQILDDIVDAYEKKWAWEHHIEKQESN